VISLQVAVALILLGALVAMLGSAWLGMTTNDRLTTSGIVFVVVLVLLNLDPLTRGRR
jgi:hypothetical protein